MTINPYQMAEFDCNDLNQVEALKQAVYKQKIVILKNQQLTADAFLSLSQCLGKPEAYYQPMYHHPQVKEVFVSSNLKQGQDQVGVPKTGRFWHADYSFMPKPFGITLIYPQVVPKHNRGTYFIDMGLAYQALSDELKQHADNSFCHHSVRNYFKIRPSDVYRPMQDVLAEIEQETPQVTHPTSFKHPITGETILYLSDGFSQQLVNADGKPLDASILEQLLAASGQKDRTHQHPAIHLQTFEQGDILIWDNRSLVHCALHSDKPEPTESYRLTVHDEDDFYHNSQAYNAAKQQTLEAVL